jgi:3-dehydroquinate synthetase
MVKIALVLDRAFYRHLESVWPHLLKRNKTVLRQAITRAVKLKLSVVAEDPFEKTGKRRLLNFGHTVGHALESATRYKKFRHGEAVLWGMRVAVVLSEICGHLAPENGAEIQKFLKQFPVGPWPAAISTRDLLPFIKRDKKAEGQSIPYILLKAAGESTIDRKVTPADLTSALARIKNDEI